LKATTAFTSEEALFASTGKPVKYIALRSQVALQICKENGIDRIVIDNKLGTMMVLRQDGDA
jgi:hypothetical protein